MERTMSPWTILVGKPLGKHSLGIPIKKWKINIKKAFFVGF
jgi:hypothetical protein